MTDATDSPIDKGLRVSAWFFYVVIGLEILFMVSPFALYYYSVYAFPLTWLQQSSWTAWLTLHIFPHFTHTESVLSNVLIVAAWPLILLGLVLFLVGFVQIYWSKITRKANVESGLYRYVRHPQYLALAVVGLGASLYWSRFIVVIAYVTMLFVYYALARHEERVCLAKFGDGYRDYQSITGMFLPGSWLRWLPGAGRSRRLTGWRRAAAGAASYLVVVALVSLAGWGVKRHVLGRMTLHEDEASGGLLVAVAPLPLETLERVREVLNEDTSYRRSGPEKALVYVVPAEWGVPELGLARGGAGGGAGGGGDGDGDREHEHGLSMFLRMPVHGNARDFDPTRLRALVTEPVLLDPHRRGKELLLSTIGYEPKLVVELDMKKARVVHASDEPSEGQWAGIPVPVY